MSTYEYKPLSRDEEAAMFADLPAEGGNDPIQDFGWLPVDDDDGDEFVTDGGPEDTWQPEDDEEADEVEKSSNHRTGIMICLYPVEGTADWSSEEPPHLTLVYAGKVTDEDVPMMEDMAAVVERIALEYGTQTVSTVGLEELGDNGEANVVRMEATDALTEMRSAVSEFNRSQHKDFKPHVTIDNDGAGGGMESAPESITFDRVALHYGEEVMVFDLGTKIAKSVSGTIEDVTVSDDDKRLVFGWASVITDENGDVLVDRQGDYIDSEWEMESAAYQYMIDCRVGGMEHLSKGVATVVESMVYTKEKKAALGLPDSFPTGWWLGMRITDDEVWALAKSGQFSGFSVHGKGIRTPHAPESTTLTMKTFTGSRTFQ